MEYMLIVEKKQERVHVNHAFQTKRWRIFYTELFCRTKNGLNSLIFPNTYPTDGIPSVIGFLNTSGQRGKDVQSSSEELQIYDADE